MVNRVVLVGRLTRDPELRFTPNNVANATFTLAVNRTFTNQQGQREADFINIVVWNRQAENVNRYVRQGSLVAVEGRIQTRNYQAQDGTRRYVTEVVAESVQFLDSKNGSDNRDSSFNSNNNNNNRFNNNYNQMDSQSPISNYQSNNQNIQEESNIDPFSSFSSSINISDDDLPF